MAAGRGVGAGVEGCGAVERLPLVVVGTLVVVGNVVTLGDVGTRVVLDTGGLWVVAFTVVFDEAGVVVGVVALLVPLVGSGGAAVGCDVGRGVGGTAVSPGARVLDAWAVLVAAAVTVTLITPGFSVLRLLVKVSGKGMDSVMER